uniref:Uncharacterized protein n=1 Tax=Cacopsylla melanoneura TaxID=428564 RepID=A0A8D8YTD3_9HEMI
MFPTMQRPARIPQKSLLLCLIILHVQLIQSVTVNPNQDKSETSTAPSQSNWKSTFQRNNKEVKFIPTHKQESKKIDIELPAEKEDTNPLNKTYQFGQRKQNLDRYQSEDVKTKRTNLLNPFRSRNNTKGPANNEATPVKESNKIDIILLPQDESEEVSTRPSSYRRRYRKNKHRQHHRKVETSSEASKTEEHDDESKTKENVEKNVTNKSQNETNEDLPINRLFNKNKRRLYGNRYNLNQINKEANKEQTTETPNENEKVEKDTTKVEKEVKVESNTSSFENENNYKIDLNEDKKEETEKYVKVNRKQQEHKTEPKPEFKPSPEYNEEEETPVIKEYEYEKTDKLVQKYRVPTVSTMATPIEILSTYPSSSYFENNSFNKASTSGLSNMQLLHTLGMRKVRQPNHHNKRHQQDLKSKSRSQYNINGDSQMYIVKLPPQPYYYLNEKSNYNVKPSSNMIKNNLPIKMVNNGKIDKVYHYNLPLVEKLMTGRKTYSNKVHKIHDPVQPYFGPYSHNEYENMSQKNLENKKPFTSNKKYDSDSQASGNGYKQDHKKVIPVHEDNMSYEDTNKQLDSRHDYTKYNPSEEHNKFNVKEDYSKFDPSDAYKKFDAQENYKKFNEKAEYDKFNPTEDYKPFDTKYDFEKFKPDSDFKTFDSADEFNKFKVGKPLSYHSKGTKGSSHQDSKIINIKPGFDFGSSSSLGSIQYNGNTINDKTYPSFSDKNYRHYDRVMSSSVSPIYMKPYVHRYYTNNGRPKSIYVLPQYHKT